MSNQISATIDNADADLKPETDRLATALADVQAMAAALTGYLMAAQGDAEQLYKVGLGSVRFLLAVGDLFMVSTSNGQNEGHTRVPSPRAPSLIAVNKHSGEVVWRAIGPGEQVLHGQWSSPAAADVNGRIQVLFGGGDGWLRAFEVCENHTGPYAHAFHATGGLFENAKLAREYEKVVLAGEQIIERKVPGPLGVSVSLRTQMQAGARTEAIIYAHGDGRANRLFTGKGGMVVQSATYGTYGDARSTAYGDELTQSDDLWNFGDNLPEVGVVLLGPRAYDPELGRFLQRDPISIALRASTAHPYAFAFSNPVDFADPTGLLPSMAIVGSVTVSATPPGGLGAYAPGLAGAGAVVAMLLQGQILDDPQAGVGASGFRPINGFDLLRQGIRENGYCGTGCELGRDVSGAAFRENRCRAGSLCRGPGSIRACQRRRA